MWLRGLIGVFGVLSLVVFASAAMPAVNSQKINELINSQLMDLQNNQIDRAYAVYTSKDFREVTSLKDFEGLLKRYPFFMGTPQVTITALSFDQNRGVVKGSLTPSKGQSFQVIYDMTFEEGTWKISAIQILQS